MNARLTPYLLSAPALLFIGLLFLLPVGLLVASSFIGKEGAEAGRFTLAVYRDFFSDSYNLRLIGRTAFLSLITTVLSLVLAFPVALHMRQMSPRARSLVALAILSPLLTSVVVRTLAWVILLGPRGVVNNGLIALGLNPVALIYNDFGVVIGLTHVFFGYMALSLMTSLSRIDDNLLLAASNLGATRWVILRDVIIPLSRPGMLAGSILVFTMSASTYATPALLGGTGSKLMATEIYDLAINYLEWREASALSFILFVGVAAIAFGATYLAERGRGKAIFK
jgi:putative spermidine/putrescine transport system permease protein